MTEWQRKRFVSGGKDRKTIMRGYLPPLMGYSPHSGSLSTALLCFHEARPAKRAISRRAKRGAMQWLRRLGNKAKRSCIERWKVTA